LGARRVKSPENRPAAKARKFEPRENPAEMRTKARKLLESAKNLSSRRTRLRLAKEALALAKRAKALEDDLGNES
jgi:hypothetical protein